LGYDEIMNMPSHKTARSAFAILTAITCLAAIAQDKPGTSDSPLISRYQGSRLTYQTTESFVHVDVPTVYDMQDEKFKSTLPVDGARERRVYVAPQGHTVLEIHRAYVNALTAAGAKRILSCEQGQPCTPGSQRLKMAAQSDLARAGLGDDGSRAFDHLDPSYHASFALNRGGQTSYVTIMTTGDANGIGTVIDIVTPKAMDNGGIKVADANAIAQGLNTEGKMAIYGVNFDTGKAEIRPESKPQLEQMARILRFNAQLKVFIVGHTDNQGDFSANMALSQKRAEAITAALVKDYGIAASRLRAAGDANLAPVASNASEEGRARNRRVEMVVQ